MFRWIPYAMVRVTLCFTAGILVCIYIPGNFQGHQLMATAIILIAAYSVVFSIRGDTFKSIRGIISLLAIAVLGYTHTFYSNESLQSDHITHTESIQYYKVIISRYAESREKSWKVKSEVIAVYAGQQWQSATGIVLLYLSKADFPNPVAYGDVLLIKGTPRLVASPPNPGEFDFKIYLARQNIFHQHFLRKDMVRIIGHEPGNWFLSAAISTRQWADRQIKKCMTSEREQATTSALVLGVTDGLDNDLLKAYSSTGAMHVLAVSGLHVSIIYWIILLMGKPLDKTPTGKWILAIGSVIILWCYAFVSGWSPSVLRAVMMFTFVGLARPWKQSSNIYNTMASSAFCLLMYDPYFITSVGFQLSYLAVLGIVYLHPHLYLLWEPRHRIADEIWKVTSVSIAAQITTLPISLFYFHQFPNYFLLANLLVIPASFVVLVMGLALLPLSLVPFVGDFVGYVLQWIVFVMNSIIFFVEDLPFSLIENIYISAPQALALAVGIVALSIAVIYRKLTWIWIALSSTIVFAALDWYHLVTEVQSQNLFVYNISGKSVVEYSNHGRLFSWGHSPDRKQASFHLLNNRLKYGLKGSPGAIASKEFQGFSALLVGNRTVLCVEAKNARLPSIVNTDLVILCNNSVTSLKELAGKVKCEKIIIDSSNSYYLADRLMNEARDLQLPIHSVFHHGAFQINGL